MLTPQEVSDKAFPKSSFGSSGYNMAAVDEFLDTLTEDYAGLYKENATLKAKLKVLAEKIEEYRATEDAMRSALLTAQKMAANLVQEAQTEKDQILAKARADADAQIKELDNQVLQAQQRLTLAQQKVAEFIADSREMCARQAAFLDSLPDLPLAAEEPAAVEEPVTEQEIAPPEETVPVQSAEEEPEQDDDGEQDVPTGDTAVFPSDFKMSLDQLQFGRNYDGKA
ncbi:MAG: DivIVA domain-containing protein [Oscillospiraceae bacterium]|nr:DivIVA domain-containing protein [Oscillospiraceae bacterium]